MLVVEDLLFTSSDSFLDISLEGSKMIMNIVGFVLFVGTIMKSG